MRKLLGIVIASTFFFGQTHAQETENTIPSVCEIAPSLSVCEFELTSKIDSKLARSRLDDEFDRLNNESPRFGRSFALNSFSAAQISANSESYRHLRDRALVASFAAEAETGQRYYALMLAGHIAHNAGDSRTAAQTIEERLVLIRNRLDDEYWSLQIADVVTGTSKEQAWTQTSKDAAIFGFPKKAKAIVREAYPESKAENFRYFLELSKIQIITGESKAAEMSAKAAVRAAPYSFCKTGRVEKIEQSLVLDAYSILIEALSAQDKSYTEEAKKFRNKMTSECVYLSGHTQNFYSAATQFSQSAPALAQELFDVANLLNQVDEQGDPVFGDYFKEEACESLENFNCLKEMAEQQEIATANKDPNLFTDSVASAYIVARDYDSAERIMKQPPSEYVDCFRFPRYKGIQQLIEDDDLSRAKEWLDAWIECQSRSENPNWERWYGEGGNLWSNLAVSAAQLSKAYHSVSLHKEARSMAINALTLAIETESTWQVDNSGYRAKDLGRAYGSAFGALKMAEN